MPYCANLVGIWPSQVLIDTFVQFGRATPIQIIDDCVFFKYLVPRGEAYDKKYKEKMREDDK